MLEFSSQIIQFEEKGTFYLLLPKMTDKQMKAISNRLDDFGYNLSKGRLLKASSGSSKITFDSEGICWSNFDPSDLVLPLIPELLSQKKEKIEEKELLSKYVSVGRKGSSLIVRTSTRMESYTLWSKLRAMGRCALSPDEHLVLSTIMKEASGSVSAVTDYPSELSSVKRIGKRQYYISRITSVEFSDVMGVIGSPKPRNAYLPQDGILRVEGVTSFNPERAFHCLGELGQWCYFEPG